MHYQREPPSTSQYGGNQSQKKINVGLAVAGLFAKIKKDKKNTIDQTDEPPKKLEKTELFESKHVKTIIETFNNVLTIIDQQEKDLY